MSTVTKSVDVNVPIRAAYDQWTQFESFPQFMDGVESVAQADWFASLGCRFAQGYFFARPLAPDNAERYLARVPRPMAVGEDRSPSMPNRRRSPRSNVRPPQPRGLRLVSGDDASV